jgi:hypothetical protein
MPPPAVTAAEATSTQATFGASMDPGLARTAMPPL